MNLTLTPVSMELCVIHEEDGATRVVALMSDDSIVAVNTPWGEPKPIASWQTHPLDSTWKFKTKEQLIELARNHNASRKAAAGAHLHDIKTSKYGHGYAARGY